MATREESETAGQAETSAGVETPPEHGGEVDRGRSTHGVAGWLGRLFARWFPGARREDEQRPAARPRPRPGRSVSAAAAARRARQKVAERACEPRPTPRTPQAGCSTAETLRTPLQPGAIRLPGRAGKARPRGVDTLPAPPKDRRVD